MTPIRWRKLGRVFQVAGDQPWSLTHAQVPTGLVIDDRIRVFYSTRDAGNRTSTGFFEVDAADPTRVVHTHPRPVLAPGARGAFDDCGAMATAVIRADDAVYLYYQGWNVRSTVPFQTAIGLAISRDDGLHFERYSVGPLIDRSPADPYFCSTPHVVRHGTWRMWYSSGAEWRETAAGVEALYNIRAAVSTDGIAWEPAGVALDFSSPDEGGLARPNVLADPDGWRMWYSVRGWRNYRDGSATAYRIRCAESTDGHTWRTCPTAGLEVSPSGWDSEMTAYPNVVDVGGSRYLFYSGNGFGREGIGVAVAE